MTITHAKDMTPGTTYRVSADGPEHLVGLAITVLSTVSYTDGAFFGWVPSEGVNETTHLIQVQYDAWAAPFPEAGTFAPYDVVYKVPDVPLSAPLCCDCFFGLNSEEPDMGTGVTWQMGKCEGCKAHAMTFKWND